MLHFPKYIFSENSNSTVCGEDIVLNHESHRDKFFVFKELDVFLTDGDEVWKLDGFEFVKTDEELTHDVRVNHVQKSSAAVHRNFLEKIRNGEL